MTAEPSTGVAPGGSAIITVKVVKAGGDSTSETTSEADTTTTTTTDPPNAWGVNVTFKLLTANGGRLSALTQKTDGSGVATVVYTAGNNYTQDVIQATLENENSATVIITKTGNVPGATVTIVATPDAVNAYEYSVITATVNDGDKPVSGETVEFTLQANNSGATLVVHNAVTDSLGRATATYQAGGSVPTQDVVRATLLSNGSVSSAVIDVETGSGSGYAITVTASPENLSSGTGQSTVTANASNNSTGTAVVGSLVTFSVNGSGSGTVNGLQTYTTTTDGNGNAITTYMAAKTDAGSYYDTIVATVIIDSIPYTGAVTIPITVP